MSYPVALLAAALSCSSALAADWKSVNPGSALEPGIAYDAAAVKFEPPYVTTWTRVELPRPATLSNGVRYHSVLQKIAVDCATRRWGVTYSEFYERKDATGTPAHRDALPADEWDLHAAQQGSNGDRLIRALCTTPRPW